MPRFPIILKTKEWLKSQFVPWPFNLLHSIFSPSILPTNSLVTFLLVLPWPLFIQLLYIPRNLIPDLPAEAELLLPASPGSFCLAHLFLTHLFLTSSIFDYMLIMWLFLLDFQPVWGSLLTLAAFSPYSSQPGRMNQSTTGIHSAEEHKKRGIWGRYWEILAVTEGRRNQSPFHSHSLHPCELPSTLFSLSALHLAVPPSPWSPLQSLLTTYLNHEVYQGLLESPGDMF